MSSLSIIKLTWSHQHSQKFGSQCLKVISSSSNVILQTQHIQTSLIIIILNHHPNKCARKCTSTAAS